MARRRRQRAGIITIDASEAGEMLDGIHARLKNMTPVNREITKILQAQQAARFHEGDWEPLAESTKARKEREGESTEVFRDEKRTIGGVNTRVAEGLYNVVTTPDFPGQIKRATKTKAIFGIDTAGQFFYARLVQNVKGKKRRLLGINPADALVFMRLISRYILGVKAGTPRR